MCYSCTKIVYGQGGRIWWFAGISAVGGCASRWGKKLYQIWRFIGAPGTFKLLERLAKRFAPPRAPPRAPRQKVASVVTGFPPDTLKKWWPLGVLGRVLARLGKTRLGSFASTRNGANSTRTSMPREGGGVMSCPRHESTDVHTSVEPIGVRTESEICQLRPEAVV